MIRKGDIKMGNSLTIISSKQKEFLNELNSFGYEFKKVLDVMTIGIKEVPEVYNIEIKGDK